MKRLRFAGRSPRIAYVVAAVLLRSMDAGATVAVVLVAVHTSEVGNPVRLGALVGATLTLPHVLAPWTARLLDVRPDPRQVIALSGLWFGALLAVLVLGLGHVAPGLLLLDASAAGLVGPILTGGLSSQVSGAVGADRSATSVDALTYGLSLTLAPAMLATSATVVGARPAALALAALGGLGGLMAFRLPRPKTPSSSATDGPPQPSRARPANELIRCVLGDPDLRFAVLLTWLGAFVVAAALIAGLAEPAPRAAGVSGTVATALGLGGLVGAAALIQWPPTAAPRRGLTLTTAVLGACCLLAGLVGAADRVVLVIVAFFLLGLVNAPHTVFSLASREELSPPHLKREVFIAVAGSKVGFSSAGTAAAGLLIGAGPNQLLLGLGLVCAAAAAMAAATLRRSARRRTRLRPTQVSPMTEPHWP